MGERRAGGGAVERFEIEPGLGQQRSAVAPRGLQGAANGLDPGSQCGSDTLILPGRRGSENCAALCPHYLVLPALTFSLATSRASSPLERDVVVEVLFAACRCRGLIIIIPRRCSARAASATHGSAARSAGACAQHLHVVGDDLGGISIVSRLVLPFSGAQFALDEHLGALAQVFRGNFAQTAEQ